MKKKWKVALTEFIAVKGEMSKAIKIRLEV